MLRRRYRTKLDPTYYRRSLRELISLARLGQRPVSRGASARRPGRLPALVQPRPPSGVQEGVAWSADVRHHG